MLEVHQLLGRRSHARDFHVGLALPFRIALLQVANAFGGIPRQELPLPMDPLRGVFECLQAAVDRRRSFALLKKPLEASGDRPCPLVGMIGARPPAEESQEILQVPLLGVGRVLGSGTPFDRHIERAPCEQTLALRPGDQAAGVRLDRNQLRSRDSWLLGFSFRSCAPGTWFPYLSPFESELLRWFGSLLFGHGMDGKNLMSCKLLDFQGPGEP